MTDGISTSLAGSSKCSLNPRGIFYVQVLRLACSNAAAAISISFNDRALAWLLPVPENSEAGEFGEDLFQ